MRFGDLSSKWQIFFGNFLMKIETCQDFTEERVQRLIIQVYHLSIWNSLLGSLSFLFCLTWFQIFWVLKWGSILASALRSHQKGKRIWKYWWHRTRQFISEETAGHTFSKVFRESAPSGTISQCQCCWFGCQNKAQTTRMSTPTKIQLKGMASFYNGKNLC